jgi:PAS domain S-box-containing protein
MLDTLVDKVDLFVVWLNRMGNVEYVNPYFLEITGYEADEVVGKDWFASFLPKSVTYDVQGTFLEILKNYAEPGYDNPVITKSGQMVGVKWHNVRLVDTGGKVVGSLSIGIVDPEKMTPPQK